MKPSVCTHFHGLIVEQAYQAEAQGPEGALSKYIFVKKLFCNYHFTLLKAEGNSFNIHFEGSPTRHPKNK